jgi:hypothetical protein
VLTSNSSDFSLQNSEENEENIIEQERKPILSIDVNLGEGQS